VFYPDKLFKPIVTNGLAWYKKFVKYGQKSFIILVPSVNLVILFTVVMLDYSNKVECLSLASINSLV
jgi:hypothetical protein